RRALVATVTVADAHAPEPFRHLAAERRAAGRVRLGQLDARDALRRVVEVGDAEPHEPARAAHPEHPRRSPAPVVAEDCEPAAASACHDDVAGTQALERERDAARASTIAARGLDLTLEPSVLVDVAVGATGVLPRPGEHLVAALELTLERHDVAVGVE